MVRCRVPCSGNPPRDVNALSSGSLTLTLSEGTGDMVFHHYFSSSLIYMGGETGHMHGV